jgi:Protein of unknown function (DUF1173)
MKRIYLLDGRAFGPADPDFQQVLAYAYAAGLRPLCGCNRVAPAELYVAKIASRASYEVRRMPKAGSKHASECDHYEPPPGLSGLAQVQGHAIMEDTPADSVKSDGTKLTLRGLLHYLWHTAQLDKWYPAMEGKRTYGTMYKYISQAALGKTAKSQPLADMLYVPEPHDTARESEIRSRRMLRLAQLASSSGTTTRLGLVVGELYEFRPAQFGYQAVFKGALDCPFRVDEDLYKRMMKHFKIALSMWDQHLSDTHMMLIGTFKVDAAGVPMLNEVAAMNVTQNWLPFESIYEKSLIDSLTQQKRVFWKCLRFNLPISAHMANAVLTDTPSATALCVLPPGGTEEDQDDLVKQLGTDDMPLWFWRAGEQEMPVFPQRGSYATDTQ